MSYAIGCDEKNEFERLSRKCLPGLYSSALRMTRDPDDAHDLVQEALVKAYRGFGGFEPGTNFNAWAERIMINTHITGYRKKQRNPQTVSWEDWSGGDGSDMYRDEGPLSIPEYAVMARVLDKDLHDALEELPGVFRDSVLLRDVHNYSYEEIAEELKIPLGTVRSRIFRGRERLKEELRECAQYSGLEGGSRSTRRAEATVA